MGNILVLQDAGAGRACAQVHERSPTAAELSTGLFQAEAQWMTLLATGARLFTLVITR